MAKYDWTKLKARYVTSDITIEQLGEETNVPLSTLQKKACKEKWKAERTKNGKKKAKKVIEKATSRASEKVATTLVNSMQSELSAAEKLLKVIHDVLDDEKQWNRHLVNIEGDQQIKTLVGAEGEEVELLTSYSKWVEERQFAKADVKSLKALADTLCVVEGVHRRTAGILTKLEEASLAINREKLEIDKEKAKKDLEPEGAKDVTVTIGQSAKEYGG